jgi:hypothetical protein
MQTQAARERTRSNPILVVAAAVAVVSGCGPNVVARNFESHYQARTRVVAIAPLANYSTSPEGAAAGQAIRKAIFHELIKHQDRYTVTIQDLAETDKRIHASGMSDSSATRLAGIDLCKMIGADAVMKGSVTRYVKQGTGSQFANAVSMLFHLVNSEVKVDVAIFDGTDGKLVFQHSIEKDGDLLNARDELLNKVGSALAGKFPYKK